MEHLVSGVLERHRCWQNNIKQKVEVTKVDMAKSVLDSRCGCGQESIWMMEDNTCKCDSCLECDCDPSVCRCECHCKEESNGED